MKKLTISIINYKTADMTIAAAKSVLADLDDIDGQVVIVDNASGDGSGPRLTEWADGLPGDTPVSIVLSDRNSGFSGGHNQGMAACRAEFYLIQNSDTLVRPGFLRALLDAAEQRPDVGIFAPRIEHDHGEPQHNCFRFHSTLSEFERTIEAGLASRLLKGSKVSLGTNPDEADIEWVSFASVLLRGTMVDDVGPMDEGYFLYFEDVDYCLSAHRAGWSCAFVPAAVAIHFRGGSGPVKAQQQARAELPAYYYRSRARLMYKTHGWLGLLAANLGWHAGRIIKTSTRLLGKDVRPMPKREWRNIWLNFWAPLRPDEAPKSAGSADG